ncbi:chemotaxis-specific protein-glutamate methyltransferase CheB [Magnetococcales bacterium HHB-1]
MTSVLIIDDSALMRKYIRQILEEDGGFSIKTARDGQDGLDKVLKFQPDVVTLDINMPVMDGLTCLSRIMAESPRPVVMVSSLTEKGAMATLEAMSLGAVDYIAKPGGTVSINIKEVGPEIIAKIKAAVQSRTRRSGGLTSRLRSQRTDTRWTAPSRRKQATPRKLHNQSLLLVGASTGGPRTVEDIFSKLPRTFPVPITLAQHMPARFTEAFAKRLDGVCQLKVVQVGNLTPLHSGHLYIARGDADMVIRYRGGQLVAMPVPAADKYVWHPSVERMVESALACIRPQELVAVQLTGMGYDGAKSITQLKKQGGVTIAESEQSAIVYGMPKEVVDLNGASEILHADEIANKLKSWYL